jgi:membrane protease YdiL (CAAX protease family)
MKRLYRNANHTKISLLLVWLGIGVMSVIAFRQMPNAWGYFAMWHALFGLTGFFITQLASGEGLSMRFDTAIKGKGRKYDRSLRIIIILGVLVGIQLIRFQQLSFTTLEQFLYYIFAPMDEEMFFRGMIISVILRISPKSTVAKVLSVPISAIPFLAIHQANYGDILAMIVIFLSGCALAIFYIMWQDLTANITAHALLNIVLATRWYVSVM